MGHNTHYEPYSLTFAFHERFPKTLISSAHSIFYRKGERVTERTARLALDEAQKLLFRTRIHTRASMVHRRKFVTESVENLTRAC